LARSGLRSAIGMETANTAMPTSEMMIVPLALAPARGLTDKKPRLESEGKAQQAKQGQVRGIEDHRRRQVAVAAEQCCRKGHDADQHKAEDERAHGRQRSPQRGLEIGVGGVRELRHGEAQDQQGHRDGEDAVAQGQQPANRPWSAWPTTSRLYGGPSALARG
jgi:hypothetical protein